LEVLGVSFQPVAAELTSTTKSGRKKGGLREPTMSKEKAIAVEVSIIETPVAAILSVSADALGTPDALQMKTKESPEGGQDAVKKKIWRKEQLLVREGSLVEIDVQETVETVVVGPTGIQEEETKEAAACGAVEDSVVEIPAPTTAIAKYSASAVLSSDSSGADVPPIFPSTECHHRNAQNTSRGRIGGVRWRRMID
jgi:hypothetical protein